MSRRAGTRSSFPPEGVLSAAAELFRDGRQGRGARPEPSCSASNSRPTRSCRRSPTRSPFIYKKAILDKDPHWYEKNILGSGPFKFAGYETGQSIKGVRNPDYYHKGLPYLDGFTGIYADKQATRSTRSARPRRDRVPRPAALGARRAEGRARRQDRGAGERLELRQPRHPEPQEKAVRRCPGAPRADPGDRPLARRPALSKIANVHTVGGIVFPGLAAGRDQGGAAADRRLSGPTSRNRAPRRSGC
jgi:peptide/nickel transport system substrate-binding protein